MSTIYNGTFHGVRYKCTCEKHCFANPLCTFWTYDKKDFICYLKNYDNIDFIRKNSRFVSGWGLKRNKKSKVIECLNNFG